MQLLQTSMVGETVHYNLALLSTGMPWTEFSVDCQRWGTLRDGDLLT